MEKFHIKKISEINEKKLKEFYFKAFNFQKEIIDDHFWRYRSGHNNFEPLALIIEDKICGHAGLIPVDIKINNKIEKSIWFTDFFIEKNYRSMGYGKILTESWMKICPTQITLCNEKSLKIFKKLNWSHNRNFIQKKKIFNYLNIMPIFKNSKSYDSTIEKNNGKFEIENVNNKIISKLIDISEKKIASQKTALVRDENWFKWRIIDCPYKKNIFILRYKEKYIVIHILKKNNLKRLNIIFTSEDINPELLGLLTIFSKKNDIDYLSFVEKKNKFIDGFLPGQRKLNFAFYSNDPLTITELKQNLSDIQYIDSDIDFI